MKSRQITFRLEARDHQQLKEYVHRAEDDLSVADLCRAGVTYVLRRLEERPLERHIERYLDELDASPPFSVDGITPQQLPLLLAKMRQFGPGAHMELSFTWNEDDTLRVDVHEANCV